MPNYRVWFETGASAYVDVEAEDEEAAEEKAWEEVGPPSLCAQCSGWGQRVGIELGEWETGPIDQIPD